ncbi:MAG: polysaccharide deacetylase family protein [Clostridia bacterium]|nr:polysaccharide deacetylase family protein [Clostridia bacterium]
MNTVRKKAFIGLLLCSFFLSACSSNQESRLPLDRNKTIIFPAELPPQSAPIPEQNVWDVSNVNISTVDKTRKLVALTFDDAPQSMLENLLAVFANFNQTRPNFPATATVFCNGRLIHNENKHTLSAACAMGWELGNHAFSHTDLTTLSVQEKWREISDTDALLQAIDGKERHLFRPPFGKLEREWKALLPVPIVNWTIDTLDWTGKSPEEIQLEVLQNTFDGAIVLLHDSKQNTVDAVKTLLPKLYENGYQAVTLSAMAKAHGVSMKNGAEYIRLRKNATD